MSGDPLSSALIRKSLGLAPRPRAAVRRVALPDLVAWAVRLWKWVWSLFDAASCRAARASWSRARC